MDHDEPKIKLFKDERLNELYERFTREQYMDILEALKEPQKDEEQKKPPE